MREFPSGLPHPHPVWRLKSPVVKKSLPGRRRKSSGSGLNAFVLASEVVAENRSLMADEGKLPPRDASTRCPERQGKRLS